VPQSLSWARSKGISILRPGRPPIQAVIVLGEKFRAPDLLDAGLGEFRLDLFD